jgi:hypothetical protein
VGRWIERRRENCSIESARAGDFRADSCLGLRKRPSKRKMPFTIERHEIYPGSAQKIKEKPGKKGASDK